MTTRTIGILAVLVACSPVTPAPTPTPTTSASTSVVRLEAPMTPEAIARELVTKLAAHDFAGSTARFDAAVTAGLPKEKLEEVWSDLEKAAGAFAEIVSASESSKDGHHLVVLDGRFARAHLSLRVTVNAEGKIEGFRILPPEVPWAAPGYVKADSFDEKPVMVGAAPALPGTLAMPHGAGPFPAVVLVHGSGPNDADETMGALKPFKDLAQGLASRGVCVLRYTKRTRVDPKGVTTQKEEVDDGAHAAVALLAATPGVDAKRVALLGHSQGGNLAPRIAKADPAIRGVVVLAGNTRSLQDALIAQARYFEALSPSEAAKTFVAKAEAFKREIDNPALKADDVVALPTGGNITGAYFLEMRGYRPEKVAASLTVPILLLQGERDYQVTIKDDFATWKTALAGKKNATFKTYPASNHAFVAGTGTLTPAEYERPGHVEEQVVIDIADFVTKLR